MASSSRGARNPVITFSGMKHRYISPITGDRARPGCGACRPHKTFLSVYVRKRLAITRSLTYNRTYSSGPLRSPIPHCISRARVSVGESEDPGAHRGAEAVSSETAGSAQRVAERPAIETAGRRRACTTLDEVEAEAQRPPMTEAPRRERRAASRRGWFRSPCGSTDT